MLENSQKKQGHIFGIIKFLLDLLLIIAVLAALAFIIYQLALPTADEYDDPKTSVQESFPWTPNIMSAPRQVVELYLMGLLRHLALLPNNVTAVELITMVSYVFFVLFISRIRITFLQQEDLGIKHYVEWSIGSIIGAIIYIAGSTSIRRFPDVAVTVVWFALACIILHLIHPQFGLLNALKEKISGTKKTEKQAKKKG